jgi:ferrous iron transport protein B
MSLLFKVSSQTALTPTLLIIGFPNAGKTTLFNLLTKSKFKTVNYPGSTVDYAVGHYYHTSHCMGVVDTPGLRSFSAKSSDEQVTMSVFKKYFEQQTPIHLLVVLDQTQLNRQLVLAQRLSRLNVPMTLILTQRDIAMARALDIDFDQLSTHFDCPVFSETPRSGTLSDALWMHLGRMAFSKNVAENWMSTLKSESVLSDYADSDQILKQCYRKRAKPEIKRDLDGIFLHPIWGGVCFFVIMCGLFWSVFSLASPFMNMIDVGIGAMAQFFNEFLPNGYLSQFVSEGLIPGIGASIIFVPQIFLLFFLIGVLEETGYLARGAVIVDKPLSMVGLSGKSFVPLLSGCACAIPAMMAARTITHTKARLVTLFIIPLMTCSARLPVYGLLISILFFDNPLGSGIAFTGIYIGSVALASLTAAIVSRVIGLKKSEIRFDMILPQWHSPQWLKLIRYSVSQTVRFCTNAGPIIAFLSVIIWGLSTFPSPEYPAIRYISDLLDPLLLPMGVDGRVGMALLLAFVAREVFVSTLALIFTVSEDNTLGLIQQLTQATIEGTTMPLLSTSSSIGLIVFFMVSMQCMSTLAIAKQEIGKWKLPIVMMIVYTVAAYFLAVVTVQGLRLIGIT